jgi:hypothetical protein
MFRSMTTSKRERRAASRFADTGLLGASPGWNMDASYRDPAYECNITIAAGCAFAYHGAMATCFNCGHELPPRDKIFRATLCENCGADLRVCKNCTFYLPGTHWDCRETIPEAVREKDRANFCEYFRTESGPGTQDQSAAEGAMSVGKEETARDQFKNLFGDS